MKLHLPQALRSCLLAAVLAVPALVPSVFAGNDKPTQGGVVNLTISSPLISRGAIDTTLEYQINASGVNAGVAGATYLISGATSFITSGSHFLYLPERNITFSAIGTLSFINHGLPIAYLSKNKFSVNGVGEVLFARNTSLRSDGSPGGVWTRTDGGCIAYDINSGAGTASTFEFSHIDNLKFVDNVGGLFRCTDLIVSDTNNVEFRGNKAMLVYGYNLAPRVSFSDVDKVLFEENGTSSAPLFTYCKDVTFTNCDNVTFNNNTVGTALFTERPTLTNVGKLVVTGNTTTEGLFDKSITSYGIIDSVIITGNKGNAASAEGGLVNNSVSNSSLILHGGRFTGDEQAYVGKGNTVDISGNEAIDISDLSPAAAHWG